MKSSLRLTTLSKVLILLLIIGLIGGGIFAGVSKGFIKTNKDKSTDNATIASNNKTTSSETVSVEDIDEDGNVINTAKSSSDTINLSLDEWIG